MTMAVLERRAGFRRPEPGCLRDHVRRLISAPRMPLNPDRAFVDDAAVDDRLNGRQHAFQRALAGIADRVDLVAAGVDKVCNSARVILFVPQCAIN